ncbi:hypothetical protein H2136_19705 [Aeromonas hydrophila]|uniref:Uncharacterized protein n=1 Tax=Aeromonas hydrophila TaxID=644 RepID=A0A926IYQ8_AERHY|nr:hypothetical protein [Aeromonas hydrophila]
MRSPPPTWPCCARTTPPNTVCNLTLQPSGGKSRRPRSPPLFCAFPCPFSPEAMADKFAALPIGTDEDAKFRERVVPATPHV